MSEQTLAIIKPDAVRRNIIGKIITMAEEEGLTVAAAKMLRLSQKEAEGFYHVHRGKGFFESLTRYMSEGPILVMVLQGENAVDQWRRIMGATDPARAADGTIRKLFGENIERNAAHGSDSCESARFEIGYFFNAIGTE